MNQPTPLSLLVEKYSYMDMTLQEFLNRKAIQRRDYIITSLSWDCSLAILAAAIEDKDRRVRFYAAQSKSLTRDLWLKAWNSRSKYVRSGAAKHPMAKEWACPLYELREAAKRAQ